MNLNKNGNVVIRPTLARNVYVIIAKYAAQAGVSPTKFIVTILTSWANKKIRDDLDAFNRDMSDSDSQNE